MNTNTNMKDYWRNITKQFMDMLKYSVITLIMTKIVHLMINASLPIMKHQNVKDLFNLNPNQQIRDEVSHL